MALSWSKTSRSPGGDSRRTTPQGPLVSYSTKTANGTAVVHELEDGQALLDMWRPDQTNIGTGKFPNADAAKTRAETILDPRTTCWDLVVAWCDDLFAETS